MEAVSNTYLRLDAYLIRCAQEGYLYLLDRTGIYVATLAFWLYVPTVAQNFTSHPILNGFLLIVVAGSLSRAYMAQDKGDNALFNAVVDLLYRMKIRHFFHITLLSVLPVAIASLDVVFIFSSITICMYMYVLLVKIRDRDKKPFFEKKTKQEVAMEQV